MRFIEDVKEIISHVYIRYTKSSVDLNIYVHFHGLNKILKIHDIAFDLKVQKLEYSYSVICTLIKFSTSKPLNWEKYNLEFNLLEMFDRQGETYH